MKIHPKLLLCLLLPLALLSCRKSPSSGNDGANSIYYWRTTFSLNDAERKFLKQHDIKKMYVRFFDVDYDFYKTNGEVVPSATIRFKDSVPQGIEVVPTIYITTKAMQKMQTKEDEYAAKILKRVNAICRQNKIEPKELQLDCDWTKHTREYFFRLCESMKQNLDSSQSLSSTIRLHQLTQTPPPVDKGVLMVYNTGNLMEMTAENSIFSRKDIAPYLRDNRLAEYPLPLDVAYPAYGWSVAFRPKSGGRYRFHKILRRTDFSSYPELKEVMPNIYEVNSTINLNDGGEDANFLFRDHIIKVERPTAKEILEVKRMIDKKLNGKTHNNILYHLDEAQLSHYSTHEVSEIYSRH